MRYSRTFLRHSVMLAAIISLSLAGRRVSAVPCPCDIYATGGTPCVAAHSVVRALYGTYNGPLYQVRRKSDNTTKDIGVLKPGGYANAAAVDSFLKGTTGTISVLYDQSEKKNDLTVSLFGSAKTSPLNETPANRLKDTIAGHPVYPIATVAGEGYRRNNTTGVATGTQAEGMYMVTSGKRFNSGCCFDYGNAESDAIATGKSTGAMEALYFGSSCWFSPCQGSGPWALADLEWGLFQGGAKGVSSTNTSLPYKYVSAFLKGDPQTYTIRANDATLDVLKTMSSTNRPTAWVTNKLTGAIILAIGGDSSPSGMGNFYEGAMTIGRPPDSSENAVQKNISAVYGNRDTGTTNARRAVEALMTQHFTTCYNPSTGNAVISYALQEAARVNLNVFNQQGRRIADLVHYILPGGHHQAVWDAKQVPAGVYIWRITVDGKDGGIGKIIIGK
jgi:non-reducing end alpha-L-arabinofuranosidase